MNRKKYKLKKQIKNYVYDHFKHFNFYPNDVEIDNKIYKYPEYMRILNNES